MNRRGVLRAAGGAVAGLIGVAKGRRDGAAASGTTGGRDGRLAGEGGVVPAQEGNGTDGNGTATPAGNQSAGNESTGNQTAGGGGGQATVAVGPNGNFVFEPGTDEPLYVTPGTTVTFVWESNTHNIVVESQPQGADWQGVEEIHDAGYEHSHTFETAGQYHYYCRPHRDLGMVADLVVNEAGAPPGDGAEAGGGEVDPEELGVPFQAHYVGIATILAIVVSLLFAFFLLKYGESTHSNSPGRD